MTLIGSKARSTPPAAHQHDDIFRSIRFTIPALHYTRAVILLSSRRKWQEWPPCAFPLTLRFGMVKLQTACACGMMKIEKSIHGAAGFPCSLRNR